MRLHELVSIATVLATYAGCSPPTKKEKRSFILMIKWFYDQWARIAPWVPCVNLRDERGIPITAHREGVEALVMKRLPSAFVLP
jgi:hypothetical protein